MMINRSSTIQRRDKVGKVAEPVPAFVPAVDAEQRLRVIVISPKRTMTQKGCATGLRTTDAGQKHRSAALQLPSLATRKAQTEAKPT